MGWRSLLAFILLALVAGAGGYAWLGSAGLLPWNAPEAPLPPVEPDIAPADTVVVPPAFAAPVIVQPGASQAEGQLLVLQARRAIEAGRPLGELAANLQLRFGQSQPQALATIIRDGKAPISNAALLADFNALASELERPVMTQWDYFRSELASLFVIRAGEAVPTAAGLRSEQIRKAIIAGNIAEAVALVRKMPGAVKAGDWLVKANRAIAVHQALDLLAQSVALTPVLPAPVPEAAPAPGPALETGAPSPAGPTS